MLQYSPSVHITEAGMKVCRVLLLVLVWLVMVSADRADISFTNEEPFTCGLSCRSSAMSSMLQAMGYSSSCVASSLALCKQLKDETDFSSHVAEMSEVLQTMRPNVKLCTSDRPAPGQTAEQTWGPRHCKDLLASGDSGRGMRKIHPFLDRPYDSVSVYCDHTVDGGGWTVLQRRTNATEREDFQRTWVEYQEGFGDMEGEFWIGLDLMHVLTTPAQVLRIDLVKFDNSTRYAKYKTFTVAPRPTHYTLTIGGYSGNAGDSLSYHNGMEFSTYDGDHDHGSINCAATRRGAWWYKNCCRSNLNGYPHEGTFVSSYEEGVVWQDYAGTKYSFMNVTMMIRPQY